jgi:hypothetical protein
LVNPKAIHKREKQRRKEEEAWEKFSKPDRPGEVTDWVCPTVPTEQGLKEPVGTENDYSILVKFPGREHNCLVRIPKGSEWAFFKAFMNELFGRPKETQSLLRFGRDSNWPLKITVATAVDQFTTLSITYDIGWDGIQCEERDISVDWCCTKFIQKAAAEVLSIPPAFSKVGVKWEATLRKENNSLRVILREGTIWTPEDPGGPQPMILFSSHSIIKIRSSATDSMNQMMLCLNVFYQGRYTVRE